MVDFKDIHIGELIKKRLAETEIDLQRVCNFMNCHEEDLKSMYLSDDLPTNLVLKWSKLLEYDFFRIYSQHLILYSPPSAIQKKIKNTNLPVFRKNIYTREIIDFILEQIHTGEKTIENIIKEYRIPKSTLLKWKMKYEKPML